MPPSLIALMNSRGGSGKAKIAMKVLSAMNNCQVVDIMTFAGEKRIEADENLLQLVKLNKRARFVFVGGDGTIGWAFSILKRLEISCPVAFLPLGTANQISLCTGWKNSFKLSHLESFVFSVQTRPIIDFDLWDVCYQDDQEFTERRPSIMGAFLSFGLDARIAYKFHKEREKKANQPTIFESKLSYFKNDVKVLFSNNPNLNEFLHLIVDGNEIELPASFECLQVLNINAMSGDVNFFGKGKSRKSDILKEGEYSPPKLNDRKLEVVLEYSLNHYNLCFLGLARAVRVAQGDCLTIKTDKPVYLEVDGEPFLNPAGSVTIRSLGSHQVVLGKHENSFTKSGINQSF